MSRTTGIVIFDEVEELDFAGPWEVFTAARNGHEADRVPCRNTTAQHGRREAQQSSPL